MTSPKRFGSFHQSLACRTARIANDDTPPSIDVALARYGSYLGMPTTASISRNDFVVERSTSPRGTTYTRSREIPSATRVSPTGCLGEGREPSSPAQIVEEYMIGNEYYDTVQDVPKQDEIMGGVDAELWAVDVEASLDVILVSCGSNGTTAMESNQPVTHLIAGGGLAACEERNLAPLATNIPRRRAIAKSVQYENSAANRDCHYQYPRSQHGLRTEVQWNPGRLLLPRDEDRHGETRRSHSLLTRMLDLLRNNSEAR
ncbi:hypothetical protein NQ176_g4395 [Zarea fungicola]|uniref:Uncharacterized protein n=1 Tax=Zarea fungicola TaxID=93591 RepID=A0ACC1NFU9_9HYPO|nr:hypothetical protein NQ176_g4395 [Lecanicillium fungicola]